MKKYSIVIPVYNVENYLRKCLDSVINQSYKSFDVIIVNDGSTDNSLKIALEYSKKYDFITIIDQENKGLSEARNNGIKRVKTPYFILLDSDDYLNTDLLRRLDEVVSSNENVDIIRYQACCVNSDKIINYNEEEFYDLSGIEAFEKIVKFHYVENAWLYLYNTDYFKENGFKYPIGKVHEDFALTPLVIYKAKHVYSITYAGYNYVLRSNSIINSNDYSKTLKKVSDFYDNYLSIVQELDKVLGDKKVIKSYLANSLIYKITELTGNDYKMYFNRLKEDKVFENLLVDTLSRKIKKFILKINPKLYYRR